MAGDTERGRPLEKVRFGIIGCGVIAPWHARGITNTPEAELVAVCDVIEERAQKLSADLGGPAVYTDHIKMLEEAGVDAVCVCVPSGLHGPVTIDAANYGKHVMCEKPVEITLPKIDAMIDACKQADVKLGVIFQRRTAPMWSKIKKAVDSGQLGKMVLGDAYLKYHRSQEYYDSGDWRGTWELDGGGALMNQGVHCIDLQRWIMGPVDTVYAQADHLVRNIEVEDTCCAVMKFKSGAFGVLQGTTSVVGMNHKLEFHGDQGTICVDGESITKWKVPGQDEEPKDDDDTIGSAASDPKAISTEGHAIQIRDLCLAIMENREPMVGGEEARKAVEVILAIYESARTGQPVKIG